jgi:hypothetical protein
MMLFMYHKNLGILGNIIMSKPDMVGYKLNLTALFTQPCRADAQTCFSLFDTEASICYQ